MTVRTERREAAIERMADHVLAHGLAGASLRPLAAAAGASDRMLLYYFADKDDVLSATLGRVAARLTAMLDAALAPGLRLPGGPLLQAVWSEMSSPSLAPYMRVWLEVVAGAAHGQQPHRTIAAGILGGFADWIGEHLDAPEPERAGQGALLLATVDGALLLDAAGRRDLAEAAIAASVSARL
ncbi:MAG: TetR/AcrR family transcriptional regulator [Caulobacteraceae bacterium]|nr:MAG: TetR/AcrR family transcriptional regulator [Caulobacteraceae bacterium]